MKIQSTGCMMIQWKYWKDMDIINTRFPTMPEKGTECRHNVGYWEHVQNIWGWDWEQLLFTEGSGSALSVIWKNISETATCPKRSTEMWKPLARADQMGEAYVPGTSDDGRRFQKQNFRDSLAVLWIVFMEAYWRNIETRAFCRKGRNSGASQKKEYT